MRSARRERNKAKSKSQVMTKGGVYDYNITPNELSDLVKTLTTVPANQLSLLLDALLTKRELVDITRRVIVGKLILTGKSYDEINQIAHVSSSTISSVHNSLQDYDGILEHALLSTNLVSPRHKGWEMNSIEKQLLNRIKKGK